jgi:glycerophosphoryl diester phosphodiesterase
MTIGICTRPGNPVIYTWIGNTMLTIIQEVGVDVLEMDTVFTKDGIPVIWHDVRLIQHTR